MAKLGRPRIYNSPSEKMKAYRESKKNGGAIRLDCYVPSEYREQLDQVCKEINSSLGEGICFLLDFYFENRDAMDAL